MILLHLKFGPWGIEERAVCSHKSQPRAHGWLMAALICPDLKADLQMVVRAARVFWICHDMHIQISFRWAVKKDDKEITGYRCSGATKDSCKCTDVISAGTSCCKQLALVLGTAHSMHLRYSESPHGNLIYRHSASCVTFRTYLYRYLCL